MKKMSPSMHPAAVAATAFIGLAALIFIARGSDGNQKVMSFEECQAKGYPVQESYPPVCRTPDGQTFTDPHAGPVTPNAAISREKAVELIKQCQATGTYSLHNGELGLILQDDSFQPVEGAQEEDLRKNQNPACPFTKAAIE